MSTFLPPLSDQDRDHVLSPGFVTAMLFTTFLGVFYMTVTNMAGIYIVSSMGGSHLISIYAMVYFALGNALGIPLAQPLAHRFGTRYTLVGCLIVYACFSTLCALAPNFIWFNIFRLGLGWASGPFYIIAYHFFVTYASPKKRQTLTSFLSAEFSVVPTFGVCFGGWLAYEAHWRWIFHVNGPTALLLA